MRSWAFGRRIITSIAPERALGETMGNIISRSYEVLQEERPDALLILGDTNSALIRYLRKTAEDPHLPYGGGQPLLGLRTCPEDDQPAGSSTTSADVNLPYTEHSRRYLLTEGIDGKGAYLCHRHPHAPRCWHGHTEERIRGQRRAGADWA